MSSQVPLPSEKTIPEKRWSCIYLQAAGKIISVLAAASPEKVGLLLPIGVITVYRISLRMSNFVFKPLLRCIRKGRKFQQLSRRMLFPGR